MITVTFAHKFTFIWPSKTVSTINKTNKKILLRKPLTATSLPITFLFLVHLSSKNYKKRRNVETHYHKFHETVSLNSRRYSIIKSIMQVKANRCSSVLFASKDSKLFKQTQRRTKWGGIERQRKQRTVCRNDNTTKNTAAHNVNHLCNTHHFFLS